MFSSKLLKLATKAPFAMQRQMIRWSGSGYMTAPWALNLYFVPQDTEFYSLFIMYCLFFVFLFCLIVDSGGKYLHRFQRSPLRQLLLSLSFKWTEGCINGSKSTFGFVFIYFFSKENSTIISRFFYQFFDRNFLFFQACMTVLHFNFSFTPSVFSAMRVAQYYFAGMAERVIYSLPGQFPADWSPPLSSLRCNKVLRGGR